MQSDLSEGRTAGRAPPSGRLRVGQIVASGNGKSSIPSRFETILFKGNREANAFGRRTHRFNEQDDDLPGPGSYKKTRTLVKHTPSLSKKGTGAFASSSKIAADQPRALFLTPGPGSYKEGEGGAAEVTTTISAGHPAVPSASFAKAVPRRAVGVKASGTVVLPGPGEYEIDTPQATQNASAVFGSKTQRIESHANSVPGPGEYLTDVPHAPGRHSLPSAVFRTASKRETKRDPQLGELAKTLPQPPHKGPQGFAGTGREREGGSPKMASRDLGGVVGGGGGASYEEAEDRGGADAKKAPKPSSMFATTLLDRFGRPVVKYAPESADPPGPGQYDIEAQQRRLLISSSWAMSGTERFQPPITTAAKPPGMSLCKDTLFFRG